MGELKKYKKHINKKIFFEIFFFSILLTSFFVIFINYFDLDKKIIKFCFFGFFLILILELFFVIFLEFKNMNLIKRYFKNINNVCENSKMLLNKDYDINFEDKNYNNNIDKINDILNFMTNELKKSEKIKNDFVSSVSHELRTPLTAIKGWAETMQICDSNDTNTINRGLDTIVREAGRLSWVVESMLDFSSIKDKKINLITEKIDILAELGEAVYMFKNRAENEKKTLIYNEPKNISFITGDKNRIKQIFINILDNAFKYTSEGDGISVSVSEKNEKISVQITDNGCGIPQKHLPNVTKKFYKANYTRKGSGIGLAIVNELVNLHNGELNIISEENFGTTVTVNFPINSN